MCADNTIFKRLVGAMKAKNKQTVASQFGSPSAAPSAAPAAVPTGLATMDPRKRPAWRGQPASNVII